MVFAPDAHDEEPISPAIRPSTLSQEHLCLHRFYRKMHRFYV